jgi:hypothetical protein
LENLDWDTTLKLLVTASADRLLPMLGESGQVDRWLNVELPKTQNLRVDLLAELTSGQLVHFELQSRNGRKMPFRMLEYGVVICRREGRYPVQILIYAGNDPLRMPNHFRAPGFEFRFEIVDLKALDGARLLESENVSENLLALLMTVENKIQAIQRIITRIGRLEVSERLDAITRLLLTCRMRKLSPEIDEEITKMSMTFNIETDKIIGPYYRKGVKTGKVQGRAAMLRRMIRAKFGSLPKWAADHIATCSPQQIDGLGVRLIGSSSLEQLFPRH